MGVSSSPRELAAKLDKLGRDLNNVRVPLNATALHVKRILETAAAASAARSAASRGDKRKLIGVRYDLKGARSDRASGRRLHRARLTW